MAAREETFRAYTAAQGAAYAAHRLSYHPDLIRLVVDHHTATGGGLGTVVDVGCGPGTATLALAPHFSTEVVGLDPSEGMIATARGRLAEQQPPPSTAAVRFDVSTAEDMEGIPDGSVDLVTAATAAHWFDMPRFWARAARVLRPGGSVALWAGGPKHVHPAVPNAEAIEAEMDVIEHTVLRPYMEPGNLLARDLYVDLELPWPKEGGEEQGGPAAAAFDRASFFRKDTGWTEPGSRFFTLPDFSMNMDQVEAAYATMSPVQRWREAHPEVAVGSEADVARVARRTIERLLRAASVEDNDMRVKAGVGAVLLIVKRK